MQAKQKSGFDKKIAAHVCNVARRLVQSQFPHLTPLFIVYEPGGLSAALEREYQKAGKKSLAHKVISFVRENDKRLDHEKRTRFVGMNLEKKGSVLDLGTKQKSFALFFMNLQHFSNEFEMKIHALSMIWNALKLEEDYWQKRKELSETALKLSFRKEETFEEKDGVLLEKLSARAAFHRNMGADFFAAAVLFFEGEREAIKKLASFRMKKALTAQEGFLAERYPFPLCQETLAFILENNTYLRQQKSLAASQAAIIANDILKNYEIASAEHWKAFALPAQHAAWMGYAPEEILGCALYTTENPYVRSIATMVADITEIDAQVITSLDGLNPFLPKEKSEALYLRACENTLSRVMADVTIRGNQEPINEEIQKQYTRFQNANPHGFCAQALLKLMQSSREALMGYQIHARHKDAVDILFRTSVSEISFDALVKFSVLIFQRRRSGSVITKESMIKLTKIHPDFAPIEKALHSESA